MNTLAVTECSTLLFFNYWGFSCEQPPLTTFNQPGFDTEWWYSVEFHSRVLATPRRQILSRALDYMCRRNSIWIGNNNAIRKLCDPGRLTMATFGHVDVETPLKHSHLFCLSASRVYKCITGESCHFCLFSGLTNVYNVCWCVKVEMTWMKQNGHLLCLASANFLASIIHVFYWLRFFTNKKHSVLLYRVSVI